MFGKKSKNNPVKEVQQTDVATNESVLGNNATGKSKKRKPKEMVSSVVNESVLERILEEFKANKQFISHTPDGEVAYVGMLLRTEQIGGLSAKTNKDEAKGSIVERIRNGGIKVYASTELLSDESFVIIPDAMTIDAMDEYSLLSNLDYDLVFITNSGEVSMVGVVATVKDMSLILSDDSLHIDDSIYEDDMEETIVSEEDSESMEEIPYEDEEFESDNLPYDSDSIENNVVSENNDFAEDEFPSDEYDEEKEFVDTEDSDSNAEEDVIFTNQDFNSAITRKFYSDDLGLEVTTEPFDQQFLHNNLFIPFSENREDGWLNNYLNDMSKRANQELYRLHQMNIVELRNNYFTMVSLGAQQIVADCDYTSAATTFGQTANLLEDEKQDELLRIEELVSKEKEILENRWNDKLNAIGEAAAINARQQYKERFGRQHEDEIFHVQFNVKDDIETSYNESMRGLHTNRKAIAQKKLDAFIHEALQRAAEDRVNMLTVENIRYKELQTDMQRFMDENRKDEIARSQALADELVQSQKADAVLAEQTEKMRSMSVEYEAKKLSLLQEIEESERKRQIELAELKEKHDEAILEVKSRNKELQSQLDVLIKDYSSLDDKKEKEHSHRIAELKDEIDSWSDKCEHIVSVHKRSNILGGFLVAVVVIAGIAIGFIAGEYINITGTRNATQHEIITEFNQQMNSINTAETESTDSDAPVKTSGTGTQVAE